PESSPAILEGGPGWKNGSGPGPYDGSNRPGATPLTSSDMRTAKILCVVGTRPNFIKVAPLHLVLKNTAGMEPILVHTGQHFDTRMSQVFFEDLGLPEP